MFGGFSVSTSLKFLEDHHIFKSSGRSIWPRMGDLVPPDSRKKNQWCVIRF